MEFDRSVLLLCDDPEVTANYTVLMQNKWNLIHTAETKKNALEVLEEFPIAICIIDLQKEKEGKEILEICQELNEAGTNLKIIIYTDAPDHRTAVAAIRMGVFDYISKEIPHHQLLEIAEKALNARKSEISSTKGRQRRRRQNTVLICRNMLVKEGIKKFCSDHPPYFLLHTYPSIRNVKPNEYNTAADLVLICMTCIHTDKIITIPEFLTNLSKMFPNGKIVIINCNYNDEEKINLMKLGIRGFLPKNIKISEMKKAFDSVAKGRLWVSRELTEQLLDELLGKSLKGKYNRPANLYKLSKREVEILQAMSTGLTNVQICDKLFISENTVKVHINHIFKKLKVRSRTQAVLKSVKAGII